MYPLIKHLISIFVTDSPSRYKDGDGAELRSPASNAASNDAARVANQEDQHDDAGAASEMVHNVFEPLTTEEIKEHSFWKIHHGMKQQKKRKLICSGRTVEDVIHDFVQSSNDQSSLLNSLILPIVSQRLLHLAINPYLASTITLLGDEENSRIPLSFPCWSVALDEKC